jgi:hypothetical protein
VREVIVDPKRLKMKRTSILVVAASGLLLQDAIGHEVRHSTFPTALIGSWAETTEHCATKDKSNISIESAKYGDASGTCAVLWIVETPGCQGANYSAHARCPNAEDQAKAQTVDIIIRPQGDDRASIGRSFQDLKTYQRCPSG